MSEHHPDGDGLRAATHTPAPGETSDRTPDDGAGWQRFHPLTPLLRGGVMLVGAAGYVLSQQFDRIFGTAPGGEDDPIMSHLRIAAAITAAVIAVTVLGAWLSWRAARFRVSPHAVELRTGILFRQHRHIRYDRIQSVDIVRPLIARLFGLSEVRVVAAGGADSRAALAYLDGTRAHDLRDELMDRAEAANAPVARADGAGELTDTSVGAQGVPPLAPADGTPAAPGAAPTSTSAAAAARGIPLVLVRIPNARLVQSALFHGAAVFLAIAIPLTVAAVLLDWPGVLPVLGPAVLGVGANHIGSLVKNANFELSQARDTLKVRRGLTDLRSSTVPLGRVQAVQMRQPLLWRAFGWWRMQVNVAGVHGAGDDEGEDLLLPVGETEEALAVLALVFPDTDLDLARRAIAGEGPQPGFVGAPRSARWLDPRSWQRRGYAVTDHAVVVRGGWLARTAQWVPHGRIQSARLTQGPLERRLGLADVTLVSTPGSVVPVIAHLAAGEAERLVSEQIGRSAAARRRTGARRAGTAPDLAHPPIS